MEQNRTAPTGGSGRSTGPPSSHSPLPRREIKPPRHILVVDDDDAIRHINTEVLIHYGYHVDAAEDGAVAWQRMQRNSYDLLITDNQMPNVSGMELLLKLRDFCIPMPVIMATGTLPVESISRPGLQPAALLMKPYTPGELLQAVEKALGATAVGREQLEFRLSAPRSL